MLKATTDRLCTPWVSAGTKPSRNFDESDDEEEEVLECDDILDSESDEEDDVEDVDEFALKKPRNCDGGDDQKDW